MVGKKATSNAVHSGSLNRRTRVTGYTSQRPFGEEDKLRNQGINPSLPKAK